MINQVTSALVLHVIMSYPDDAYGVFICKRLSLCVDRAVAPGQVYTMLARLEAQGYLDSHMSAAKPVRGGRSRKYYNVTDTGKAALRAYQERIRE